MTDPTEAALSAFVARNLDELAALGGLPEGLALDRVAAELGADPDRTARWFLGDPPEEAFWCPAVGIETSTPAATCGRSPIAMNSVVPMAKPPTASARTAGP